MTNPAAPAELATPLRAFGLELISLYWSGNYEFLHHKYYTLMVNAQIYKYLCDSSDLGTVKFFTCVVKELYRLIRCQNDDG